MKTRRKKRAASVCGCVCGHTAACMRSHVHAHVLYVELIGVTASVRMQAGTKDKRMQGGKAMRARPVDRVKRYGIQAVGGGERNPERSPVMSYSMRRVEVQYR